MSELFKIIGMIRAALKDEDRNRYKFFGTQYLTGASKITSKFIDNKSGYEYTILVTCREYSGEPEKNITKDVEF